MLGTVFDQLRELAKARLVVGIAPAVPMQRIILRRVDVAVHPPRAHALDHPQPIRRAPRRSVEALDHAAMGEGHDSSRALHEALRP